MNAWAIIGGLGALAMLAGVLGARRKPGTPPAPAGPGTSTPQPSIDIDPQKRFADAALAELGFWAGRQETHPAVNERLVEYWKAASNGAHPLNMFGDGWESAQPWSAAFVSYVANQALPGALMPAQGHWTYAKAALQNRGVPGRFEVIDARLEPVNFGDIILRNRKGNKFIFDDLAKHGFQSSHGDIVVQNLPGRAEAIGGNLSHTVKRVPYPTDNEGKLTGVGTPNGPIALLRHLNERPVA